MTNEQLRSNINRYLVARTDTRGVSVQAEFIERLRGIHYSDLVELFADTLMQNPASMQLGIIAQTKDDDVRCLMVRVSLRWAMQQVGFNDESIPEV